MGTDGAANRLAQLQRYYREHPVTGPVEGHAPTVQPGTPLNLVTHDHIQASVREIADHTYALNPDAGPLPPRVEAVYDWCREQTKHADETEQQRLAVIEYRQYLEHAIRAGDYKVIPPHRCPECRTWGLRWVPDVQRAVCTHSECVDRNGLSTRLSLASLAHEHIARKNLRQASAT
jgi:hypothetical protein